MSSMSSCMPKPLGRILLVTPITRHKTTVFAVVDVVRPKIVAYLTGVVMTTIDPIGVVAVLPETIADIFNLYLSRANVQLSSIIGCAIYTSLDDFFRPFQQAILIKKQAMAIFPLFSTSVAEFSFAEASKRRQTPEPSVKLHRESKLTAYDYSQCLIRSYCYNCSSSANPRLSREPLFFRALYP